MTEEEIKSLKYGSKFTVEYTVTEVKPNDCVRTSILWDGEEYPMKFDCESAAILTAKTVKPAPKFEVGDTVRIIPDPLTNTVHNGGTEIDVEAGSQGKIVKKIDDAGDFLVSIPDEGCSFISVHCLELVKKAVKDKYEVADHLAEFVVLCDTDPKSIAKLIVSSYNKNNHPNAEAAAKAECDRLNAKWRKQQDSANA